MRQQAAFTLYELVVTLAVASILASVAVPSLQNITASSRQASSVNEFVAAFNVARSTAVTQNRRTSLCASKNGLTCDGSSWEDGLLIFTDRDSDQQVDADDTIVGTAPAVDDVTIRASRIGTALTFRPDGRPTLAADGSTVGRLTVCDRRGQAHARDIVIDLSGRPRVTDVAASGGGSCG